MITVETTTGGSISDAELAALVVKNGESRFLHEPPYLSDSAEAYATRAVRGSLDIEGVRVSHTQERDELTGISAWRISEWDSDLFGITVGRIEELLTCGRESADALAESIQCELVERNVDFCSARVAGKDFAAIHALERIGFGYQETALMPWVDLEHWSAPDEIAKVRHAVEDDVDSLASMARRMFRTDRFHNDTHFDSEKADSLYEKWVRSWLGRNNDSRATVVLLHEGHPAGLFLYEFLDAPELVHGPVCSMVLAGVDPEVGVKGLGTKLWAAVLEGVRGRARYATTVMTPSNPGVFNLYVKLGFRFTSTGVTLHWWRNDQANSRRPDMLSM